MVLFKMVYTVEEFQRNLLTNNVNLTAAVMWLWKKYKKNGPLSYLVGYLWESYSQNNIYIITQRTPGGHPRAPARPLAFPVGALETAVEGGA